MCSVSLTRLHPVTERLCEGEQNAISWILPLPIVVVFGSGPGSITITTGVILEGQVENPKGGVDLWKALFGLRGLYIVP